MCVEASNSTQIVKKEEKKETIVLAHIRNAMVSMMHRSARGLGAGTSNEVIFSSCPLASFNFFSAVVSACSIPVTTFWGKTFPLGCAERW